MIPSHPTISLDRKNLWKVLSETCIDVRSHFWCNIANTGVQDIPRTIPDQFRSIKVIIYFTSATQLHSPFCGYDVRFPRCISDNHKDVVQKTYRTCIVFVLCWGDTDFLSKRLWKKHLKSLVRTLREEKLKRICRYTGSSVVLLLCLYIWWNFDMITICTSYQLVRAISTAWSRVMKKFKKYMLWPFQNMSCKSTLINKGVCWTHLLSLRNSHFFQRDLYTYIHTYDGYFGPRSWVCLFFCCEFHKEPPFLSQSNLPLRWVVWEDPLKLWDFQVANDTSRCDGFRSRPAKRMSENGWVWRWKVVFLFL